MSIEEFEDWEFLENKMRNEGFHYCFKHYSNFEEIEDSEFHRMRLQYIDISNKLEKYVMDKLNEEIDYDDVDDDYFEV